MDETVIISKIKHRFPEVSMKEENNTLIFFGHFIIEASCGKFVISIAPKLELHIDKNFPNTLPLIYDRDNYVKDFHKNTDDSLCLATEIDLLFGLATGEIYDYFDKFLIPYFLSYEYFKKYGRMLYGERAHGSKGIFQSLAELFELDLEKNLDFIFNLFIWAAKKKKFAKIFKSREQKLFALKYLEKVQKLRSISIINLRRNYNLIIEERKKYQELLLKRRIESFK